MESGATIDSSHYLSDRGPLPELLPGFSEREGQQRMAKAVEEALAARGTLVVEAGTGTGKTLAYLIPALLSGERIIISTGTRNLQEQLFFSDLPLTRRALGIRFDAAMLKGRANYLCPHRLDLEMHAGSDRGREFYEQLLLLRGWSSRTSTGDIAEVTEIGENSPVWPAVTSTVDNCLGQECPRVSDCPVLKARAKAAEADVIIVNHHLLFADLLLKEEGLGEVLPAADGVILDEAHQLPEIATRFFGMTLTSRQLLDLGRDARREQLEIGDDDPALIHLAEQGEKYCRELVARLATTEASRAWRTALEQPGVAHALAEVEQWLIALAEHLGRVAERSRGLNSCWQRASRICETFAMLTASGESPSEYVHWVEVGERYFIIHLSPLTIDQQFGAMMRERECAWIFTSATLAVGDRFDHFVATMGLHEEAILLRLESPFDFSRQALFYLPEGLPEPGAADFTRAVVESAVPVIELCGGRTFFLFTSHRALAEAARILSAEERFNCFVQGSMPKLELLRRFLTTERSVLLATSSFWEGVDVRGADLSCVIIDKLPFLSPGDPVVGARCDALDRDGRSGFNHYLLPLAAISLRQGFGRLIRDEQDHGVFMLGDQRILTRGYGSALLRALPRMELRRTLDEVREFVATVVPESGSTS